MKNTTYLPPNQENSLKARQMAEANGFTIVKGSGRELLLDLDTEQDIKDYEVTLALLKGLYSLEETARWPSKNGKTHVILRTCRLSREERVMLQAVLGSDRKRAAICLLLCDEDDDEVSFLFRPKQE